MHTDITTTIDAASKKEYREKLIKLFLKEEPGSAQDVTEYFYYVDSDDAGHRIYIISTGNRPSHGDIYDDLASKKEEDPVQFAKLKEVFEKIHDCCEVTKDDFSAFTFKNGISVELLMKCLKWLFIEQDITYWNRSGREMLYNGLGELWD